MKTLKDYGQPGERIAARLVRLRVELIQAYRHPLEKLDPGLTAELQLSGTGKEYIEEGDILGTLR